MMVSTTLVLLLALGPPAAPAESGAPEPIPRYLPAASAEAAPAGKRMAQVEGRAVADPGRAARRAARRAQRNGVDRPEGFWWAGTSEKLEAIFLGPNVPTRRNDPDEKGCCRLCALGKACGDTCIAPYKNCIVGPGCACQRPLGRGDFFRVVLD